MELEFLTFFLKYFGRYSWEMLGNLVLRSFVVIYTYSRGLVLLVIMLSYIYSDLSIHQSASIMSIHTVVGILPLLSPFGSLVNILLLFIAPFIQISVTNEDIWP